MLLHLKLVFLLPPRQQYSAGLAKLGQRAAIKMRLPVGSGIEVQVGRGNVIQESAVVAGKDHAAGPVA